LKKIKFDFSRKKDAYVSQKVMHPTPIREAGKITDKKNCNIFLNPVSATPI
jgi:hypothetical protein